MTDIARTSRRPRHSRLNLPMRAPEDVIPYLGKGVLHWKEGRSAHALANSWFAAGGDIPPAVRAALDTRPELRGAELIEAFPERDVDLGDGGRPSQPDLVAVLGIGERLAVLTIEAKVDEPFGPTVDEWHDGGPTKARRLGLICDLLGLNAGAVGTLRYQLLHRTAAAVLEARRWRARTAVMLVQSFCPKETGRGEFGRFLVAIGVGDAATDVAVSAGAMDGVELWLGWVGT